MESTSNFFIGIVIILTLFSSFIALKLAKKNRKNANQLRAVRDDRDKSTEPFIEIHESLTTAVDDVIDVQKNTLSEETIKRFRMRNRFYS